ncbi:hypothetical protein M5K25_006718 [Dendrobium thyrsiflorum]|uniref:Uncharacterized protein n=1 Tax=Dendrobium thyrsiflorum TaxID=117978 RepID=A0ABD0VCD7_DENTH
MINFIFQLATYARYQKRFLLLFPDNTDYYIRSTAILEQLAGGHRQNASSLQLVIDQVTKFSARVQRSVYIDYTTFDTTTDERSQTREQATGSHRVHGARRSTSDAPSRSTGSRHRQTNVNDIFLDAHQLIRFHLQLIIASASRDNIHKISMKKLIVDGTTRLMNCLSFPTDEILEEQARSNLIFHCCIHEWCWFEDQILRDAYDEVMKYSFPIYRDRAYLSDVGLKILQQRFRYHNGHLAPMNILKTRIREISRNEDDSVQVNVERPIADVEHCILYARWHRLSDAFLFESYRALNIVGSQKRKEFLNESD